MRSRALERADILDKGGCKFCGETSGLKRCAWLVMEPRILPAWQLEPGHACRYKRIDFTAARVTEYPMPGWFYPGVLVFFEVQGLWKQILLRHSESVLVAGPHPCGILCCDRHYAERGEDTVYCADHWASWPSEAIVAGAVS